MQRLNNIRLLQGYKYNNCVNIIYESKFRNVNHIKPCCDNKEVCKSLQIQSSITGQKNIQIEFHFFYIKKVFSSKLILSSLQIALQTLLGILMTTLSINNSVDMICIYSNLRESYVKDHLYRGSIFSINNQDFICIQLFSCFIASRNERLYIMLSIYSIAQSS